MAIAAGASGGQLGEKALAARNARDILGEESLMGGAVHSVAGAGEAMTQGADFLVVGTIYSTRSHPGATPAGPELVRQISRRCNLPLTGIGGINEGNLGDVLAAGAAGIAVITSILDAADPEAAARRLKQAMLQAWPGGRPSCRGKLEEVPEWDD